jgi:hypothetical protein
LKTIENNNIYLIPKGQKHSHAAIFLKNYLTFLIVYFLGNKVNNGFRSKSNRISILSISTRVLGIIVTELIVVQKETFQFQWSRRRR